MFESRVTSIDDMGLYFLWANNRVVRSNAFSSGLILWDDHVDWFKMKLLDDSCFMYVIEKDTEAIGQVRFDIENKKVVVGYSLDSRFRGKGYGVGVLQCAIYSVTRAMGRPFILQAQVKESNYPSLRVFQKLGFYDASYVIERDGIITFEKPIG
jgi:RimJ/RimL family protein N-acetyltransferase